MKKQWKFVTNITDIEPQSMIVSSDGEFMTSDNVPCEEYLSTNGFKYVLLKLNKLLSKSTNRAYRLFPADDVVAKTFIPIPEYLNNEDYIEVFHKNGILTDNSVENLEWISGKYRWTNIDINDVRDMYYQVSNHGEVRRMHDKRLLSPSENRDGYYRLSLVLNNHNDKRSFTVHRLVALYFVKGRTNERRIINHIDGVKTNNYWKNLEWVTNEENLKHASMTLLLPHGEDNHNAILNDDIASKICHSLNRHHGDINDVYNEFKDIFPFITYASISSIKYGTTFNHISKSILTNDGKTKRTRHDDYETIIDIAKRLKRNNGDVKQTRDELMSKYPWISLGYIWHLKDKSVSSDITDKIFTKDEFPKCLTLNDEIADVIAQCCVKHKGDKFISNTVYNELKDIYPGLTKDHVRYIKDKRTFTHISDKYFQKGDLV